MQDITQNFIAKSRSLLREGYQMKIERCLSELSDEEIWWRTHEEGNSVGNLILHICGNARQWIVSAIGGAESHRVRQAEFDARGGVSREELLDQLRGTLAEVDEVLSRLGEAQMLERRRIQDYDVTALEAIYHVVEHFAMHAGQIILLTKMLKRTDLKFYAHLSRK
jgi:uncharacterized damage-inducible protein DinB